LPRTARRNAPPHPDLPRGRKNSLGSMRASRVRGSMTATWDAKDWFVLLRGKQYGPCTYAGVVARRPISGAIDPQLKIVVSPRPDGGNRFFIGAGARLSG
jgi:hypothetical protein